MYLQSSVPQTSTDDPSMGAQEKSDGRLPGEWLVGPPDWGNNRDNAAMLEGAAESMPAKLIPAAPDEASYG